jgi:purine-nucleoside phosphorylase
VPSRLRPKAPIAADAILVGDPGRALLLAQELLAAPRMSNHARGLWGYSGETAAGAPLTIQATGMGGPSAVMVLGDLAKLGVRRAVRVGTCAGLGDALLGELLIVGEALAEGGSAADLGLGRGEIAVPDPDLREALGAQLDDAARTARVASFDSMPVAGAPAGVAGVDMQTVAVLAAGRRLGVRAAAVLVVSEVGGELIGDQPLEQAAKRAGAAATQVLSSSS